MSDVPPSLASLYASEQAARGTPDADRERIRNAVLSTVGVTVTAAAATGAGTASAAATATTATGGIVGKLVVIVIALGAFGGGAALLSRTESTDVGKQTVSSQPPSREVATSFGGSGTPPPVAIESPAPLAQLSSSPPVGPSRISSSPLPSPSPASRAQSTQPDPSTPTTASPESDARRLARAVALSERGDAVGALAVLDGVAGGSALVEERDALRIIVLGKLGRTDEACAAVTTFVARYPQSIHRAAVEEVPCSSVQ